MRAKFYQYLKTTNTWTLVGMVIILAVILTTAMNLIFAYIGWGGKISSVVLALGMVDAIVVPALIAPPLINMLKRAANLEEINQQLEQKVTNQRQAEQSAVKRAADLALLNEIALTCATIDSEADLPRLIADKLHALTQALAVGITTYDAQKQTLAVQHVSVSGRVFSTFKRAWGRNIIGVPRPLSQEMKQQMLAGVVFAAPDVTKTTLGLIPRSAAAALKKTLGVGAFTALALIYNGDLWGTVAIILRADQPPLEREVAMALSHIIALTMRRQATEKALRHAEEKYRSIVENAMEGIFQSTPDGRFLSVNPTMARMYGYASPDEMIQSITNISEQLYVNPSQRATLHQRLETESPVQGFETQDWRKDGTVFWSSINVRAVRNEQGQILYYEGALEDITARKQAEEALRQSQERYRNFVEQSIEGIWRLAFDEPIPLTLPAAEQARRLQALGYIAECNDAMAKMYGYASSQELSGARVEQLYGGLSKEVNFQSTLTLVQSGYRAGNRETQEVTKTGETVYFLNNAVGVIENGQLVGLWGTQRDITALKRAAAEREKLIAELEAKNTELERFTYTVSHDLKSPLITIGGFLGFLEKDILTGNLERVKADVSRISAAAAKMQQLLNELLELSRIGRMMNPPQAVPFEIIAREAVELVRGRIAGCGVQVEIASNLPVVYGDRLRLVEVVQNLVDNACKFMGNQPDPRVEIGINEGGSQPVFFVRDNGLGIEPRYHEQVFGLFNQLDAQTEGTGIGLALVQRIIELHGGKIWVESAGLGQGSTFCFILPGKERL
jgi:PAS domain S-box-containing protein